MGEIKENGARHVLAISEVEIADNFEQWKNCLSK